MHEVIADVAAELLSVAVFSVLASLLTGLGLLSEQAGIASLATGQAFVGLWYLYMGTLALFAGVYLLGYRAVWPRLDRLHETISHRSG